MSRSIYFGKVMSIVDESNANRIRVKISPDVKKKDSKGETIYPWAWPLLPKTIQTMPKVGETVIVLVPDTSNLHQERFYIGPVISQYQYMDGDTDHALSFFGTTQSKVETINHDAETFGAFPTVEDVALVGRSGEDIILKDDEINIRCGARANIAQEKFNPDFFGPIFYNGDDLAYLQLKYRRSASTGKRSFINIVGNRINLMSKEDGADISQTYMRNLNNADVFKQYTNSGSTSEESDDEEQTSFDEPDYDDLTNKLHELPYGDELVQVLEVMRNAILNHTHKLGDDEPPIQEGVPCISLLKTWGKACDESKAVDLSSFLLSDTVRIS